MPGGGWRSGRESVQCRVMSPPVKYAPLLQTNFTGQALGYGHDRRRSGSHHLRYPHLLKMTFYRFQPKAAFGNFLVTFTDFSLGLFSVKSAR
jgi:hypothetical protein